MEQLIPIVSKLQDVLGAVGQSTSLDLPQIVVVGGQSSGKSSVLESLVGRSFLPRGTGIVTRRPLVLQLFNTNTSKKSSKKSKESSSSSKQEKDKESSSSSSSSSKSSKTEEQEVSTPDEWGEFLHKPGQKYYDFGAIRKEIESETDRLTGGNKGIDSTPIHLKVYSPKVLELNLVDLPGIAKVPVGDQPADIEKQIQEMCIKYISNPNAIILAVTSANTDLANSDALKLAQTIDPEGNRTVGVLTKVDLMDEGTDCADILMNQVIPLRRGYIAVVNRGQKDILSELSIRDGLKKEERYFRKHPIYSSDRALLSKCGTSHLSKALNIMLMHHIRDCLPDLKARITHMMTDVQKELEALGSPGFNANRSSRGAAMLSLLSKFANNFGKILDGLITQYELANSSRTAGGRTYKTSANVELMGGARISYIFTEVFSRSLTAVGAFDGLTDDEVRTVITNANGTRPALFVPEASFDLLVRRQVARLEQPGNQCVDLIYDELQRIAAQSEPRELTRFPILRDRINEVVATLLRRCVGPTQMMVSNLVKIELAYLNTSHPDFIGGSRAVAKLMEQMSKENQNIHQHQMAKSIQHQSIVGATPLSSSSLNNYGYEDAATSSEDYKDAVMTPQMDKTSAGLMNFIFRGNNNSVVENTTTNKETKKPSMKDSAADRNDDDGPPAIVHLPNVPDTMKQTDFPTSDRERVEMEVIKSLVDSYFGIVRKNYIDLVPKVRLALFAICRSISLWLSIRNRLLTGISVDSTLQYLQTIMYFLVNHVRDSLQNELVSELYREAEMGHLLKEADDIATRRHTCSEMKELLGKALEIVNEVRDFNTFK